MKKNIFSLWQYAVLVLCIACSTPQESADNDSYAIAYNVLYNAENDDYEVFTMSMDGTQQQNITHQPGVEWTYLSYQEELYFISDQDTCHRCYQLYRTDYQGNQPERVSEELLADSWMSTRMAGQQLILRPKNDSAFYILDHEGDLLSKLYTGMPYASDPVFVAEGRQVVYRAGRTKSKLIEGFEGDLYIINSDGTNNRRLTYYPSDDTTAGKFGYRAGPPRYHPTEQFVSYQSKQNGKYSLYGVTLNGDSTWKLTQNPQEEGWHDWSPDGRWLAIELFDEEQSQFHIGLMNWESKEMKILTDTTYRYQQAPNFVKKNQ